LKKNQIETSLREVPFRFFESKPGGRENGWIPCDHVVLGEPSVPNRSLLEDLQGKMETIGVGDYLAPGDIYQAIHDGSRAGYRIE
jgi:hypothetical protein